MVAIYSTSLRPVALDSSRVLYRCWLCVTLVLYLLYVESRSCGLLIASAMIFGPRN